METFAVTVATVEMYTKAAANEEKQNAQAEAPEGVNANSTAN